YGSLAAWAASRTATAADSYCRELAPDPGPQTPDGLKDRLKRRRGFAAQTHSDSLVGLLGALLVIRTRSRRTLVPAG
ncbi:hypothetical protein ABT234_33390, partial [Streptomyces sp. NPDC001586]|uniref:hypothetical protein n=1 Tax=Streptomyces sp. NPDC001586 TaxID=3154387 RepID=UPI00332A81F4